MRTTVTLDRDVEVLLRRAMKERGISFKEALNQAVRSGLRGKPGGAPRRYRLKTFRMGFNPELDLDKALTISAALEDEETLRKLSLRK
jgi:hypothetical protein